MRNFYDPNHAHQMKQGTIVMQIFKAVFSAVLVLVTFTGLNAQTVSGGWEAAGETGGATGYTNYGSGVIQMLNTTNTGCSGAAVHETSNTYDPTSGTTFSKCYKLFFGCPGDDEIGSDTKGDGMAFSFSKCAYNINNGSACGGGLGYMGSCGQMITIEFDTWSSQGNTGFDASYGGGTSGNHDEIAIHKDGNASDAGRLTSADAGNLEDGLEHDVCITYVPGTHILSVSIDGVTKISYDLGGTYNLQTYFGAGGLNQTWSSGKYGATNPATVSDGAGIASTIGSPLCPAGVVITSPSNGPTYGGCSVGPITITATATPPAGNTVTKVEFYIDGVLTGTDNTATSGYEYSYTWNAPTNGSHALTAKAYWSGGSTSTTASTTTITVGGGLQLTSTVPTIDGTAEALWNSYPSNTLTKSNGATGADLSATYKVMYDATNLYVMVDVTDDILIRDGSGGTWEDDGVEIFIDIGNDKVGCCSYGGNDYQYSFNWNSSSIIENKHGTTGSVTYGYTTKAGNLGYTMEMKFPWSTLGGTPTAGTYLGFDVGVNDDDNNGTRDNQLSWNDATFGEWQDPSKFGTLQFLSCDPLPVILLSFTGQIVNGNTLLTWSTGSEENNNKFIIERSLDKTSWEAIGEKSGAGNWTSVLNYSFTDYDSFDGVAYYRLVQVDFDGTYSYSNVAAVNKSGKDITIMPNPFDDVLVIKSKTEGDISISIYDVLGRLLYQTIRKSENGSLSIQPELSSGTYLITIQTENSLEQQKLIKK